MRGAHGLIFIVFGLFVWLGRQADFYAFRYLDNRVLEAIVLLMVFGLAVIVVRLARRAWFWVEIWNRPSN